MPALILKFVINSFGIKHMRHDSAIACTLNVVGLYFDFVS